MAAALQPKKLPTATVLFNRIQKTCYVLKKYSLKRVQELAELAGLKESETEIWNNKVALCEKLSETYEKDRLTQAVAILTLHSSVEKAWALTKLDDNAVSLMPWTNSPAQWWIRNRTNVGNHIR